MLGLQMLQRVPTPLAALLHMANNTRHQAGLSIVPALHCAQKAWFDLQDAHFWEVTSTVSSLES